MPNNSRLWEYLARPLWWRVYSPVWTAWRLRPRGRRFHQTQRPLRPYTSPWWYHRPACLQENNALFCSLFVFLFSSFAVSYFGVSKLTTSIPTELVLERTRGLFVRIFFALWYLSNFITLPLHTMTCTSHCIQWQGSEHVNKSPHLTYTTDQYNIATKLFNLPNIMHPKLENWSQHKSIISRAYQGVTLSN